MNSPPCQYLIIDDDEALCQVMARSLTRRGFVVSVAHDYEQAIAAAKNGCFQRAIVDLKMQGRSGLDVIAALKKLQPELSIVMLTGYSSIATTVDAIKLGASNYLCKPASVDEILAAFNDQPAEQTAIPENPPSVDRLSWEHIQRVLADNNSNISATARALGMHRRTLQRKLQKKPVQR